MRELHYRVRLNRVIYARPAMVGMFPPSLEWERHVGHPQVTMTSDASGSWGWRGLFFHQVNGSSQQLGWGSHHCQGAPPNCNWDGYVGQPVAGGQLLHC